MPATGEKLEEFLAREADKYRPQLTAYMKLISAVDVSNKVKAALYFPAIDAWQVVID